MAATASPFSTKLGTFPILAYGTGLAYYSTDRRRFPEGKWIAGSKAEEMQRTEFKTTGRDARARSFQLR
jgi:hypothetical protein